MAQQNPNPKFRYGYLLGELTAIVESVLPQIPGSESIPDGRLYPLVAFDHSNLDNWLPKVMCLECLDLVKNMTKSDFIDKCEEYLKLKEELGFPSAISDKDGYHLGYTHQKCRQTTLLTRQRIGARVKELREEKGLTQRQLADMAGIGYPHLCRIEKGQYNVSVDVLAKLSAALDAELTIE